MLFGLLESLRAQEKIGSIEWVAGEFETAWRHADVPIGIEQL
jgi:hypothetical protein